MSDKSRLYLGYCPAGEEEAPSLACSKRYLALCEQTLQNLPAACHLCIDSVSATLEVYVEYWEGDSEQVEAAQFCEACAPTSWTDTERVRFEPGCIQLLEDGSPEYKLNEGLN